MKIKNLEAKVIRRRLRSAYVTTIISISLVLFMLGLIGLLILNARRVSNYVKENIGFTIFLKDEAKEVDIKELEKNLGTLEFIKSTKFISKDEAANDLQSELSEDFVLFLGYNPLHSSISVHLLADYANPDSLKVIEQKIKTNYPMISEIYYQKNLLHLVNENVKKISVTLLIFSALLFLISFTLINNTIRLIVYSKRFLINTMKLVGATDGFIRKPFIYKSMLQGVIASLLSIILLTTVIYIINRQLNEVINVIDFDILAILFLMVIVMGVIITWVSSYFAVTKYIRIKTDELYY